jgi:hypothetical protein
MVSGESIVVEHLLHNPKVRGLSPVANASTGREKMERGNLIVSGNSTGVQHVPYHSKVKCLRPAAVEINHCAITTIHYTCIYSPPPFFLLLPEEAQWLRSTIVLPLATGERKGVGSKYRYNV